MHFNFLQLLPGVGHHYVHVATLIMTTALALVLGWVARLQLGTGEAAVIPHGRLSIRAIFEMVTEFISNLTQQVIGKEGKEYIPFFAAMFFFILLNNLIGIIPGMTPATDNINTTFAFGVFSFLGYNFIGLRLQGTHYLAHFLGPVLWLAPLMLIIELISHLLRPLTLGLRLANVLSGDHTVLAVFLDLAPFLVPIPFYCIGILVAFIQAFVFTLLSMVYVALAHSTDH